MSREKIENYDDQLLTPAESIVVASQRVANFRPLYLQQFWVKLQSFCAHWTGNFLNFLKLTQHLSLAHF